MTTQAPDARSGATAAAFVMVGVALAGLLAGTRAASYTPVGPTSHGAARANSDAPARPARSYTELMTRPWGAEPPQGPALQRVLEAPARKRVPALDPQAKTAALAARRSHRAFSGAPPSIPHPVEQANGRGCRSCHLQGGMLGDALVPPMSHPAFSQCTQCHVPERSSVPASGQAFSVASTFEPLRGAPAPSRWNASAPPQMPHTSFMRQRCDACHGSYGRHGLQSSHPGRQSCPQCHAPAAILEQMPEVP